MLISRIPVPKDTWLVEIVTDKKDNRTHVVYFLNKYGDLVENGVIVNDASAYEVISLINHMMKIHFTSDITEVLPNVHSVFNRLYQNQEVECDDIFSWQMNPKIIPLIRRYCKMLYVLNYADTVECENEAHIVQDWLDEGNDVEILEILEKAIV